MSETMRNRPTTSFTLAPDAVAEIARIAKIEGRPRSWVVEEAIKLFAKTYKLLNAAAFDGRSGTFLSDTALRRARQEHAAALEMAAQHLKYVAGTPRP